MTRHYHMFVDVGPRHGVGPVRVAKYLFLKPAACCLMGFD